MRRVLPFAAAALLSGCALFAPKKPEETPAQPAATPPAAAEPAVVPPRPETRPRRPRAEKPAPPPSITTQPASVTTMAQPAATAPAVVPDYTARCREMANNRAADARQLGASPADAGRIQTDTYRDCIAQSVK